MKLSMRFLQIFPALLLALSFAPALYCQTKKAPAKRKPTPTIQIAPVEEKKQELCALTIADSPVLRGLKLGMTMDEVRAVLPPSRIGLSDDLNPTLRSVGGTTYHFYSEEFYFRPEPLEEFKGIDSIYLGTYESRVYSISVSYTEKYAGTIDEFVTRMSEKLSLPKLWFNPDFSRNSAKETFYVNDNRITIERSLPHSSLSMRRLDCSEVQITVSKDSTVTVRLIDKATEKKVYQLHEEQEKKKKENFKL
ncbi:MAG TPA: hypothetical protein VGO50_12525 [Pyrinomonadaceae bacterium]|jgi:hypothetical protein|nr:hypothetical protein [Pyrinomonadaceae bacterium]